MAAKNTADSRRFVYRSSDKEPEPYFIPITRSGSIIAPTTTLPSMHPPPKIIRSADAITPRTELEPPARRVVLIRNTRQPQVNQGSVDLSDFGRSDLQNDSPMLTDGHKSLFLIRRPIISSEPPKPVEHPSIDQEPTSINSLEHIRTPTPPPPPFSQDVISSPDPPQSPSLRPKSSKRPENSQRHVPYLRRPRSKPRTPSPVRTASTRRSPSPNHTRVKSSKRHLSPPLPLSPPKQEESQETNHKREFFSFDSNKITDELVNNSSSPTIVENEQQTIQHRSRSIVKSAQRKKSPKSIVLVHPNDQSVAVVENSYVRGEPLRSIGKRPKSFKKTRFQDEINDESTEILVEKSRWQTCLGCLSRHMCLILIICFLVVLIGLAGVGVSAYFLATASSSNLVPKIVGIAIGGFLTIAALCFLYILLGCIGARDGYFSYNEDGSRAGGRVFAMIPPSHPNAHLYIPYDYMKMVENTLRRSTPNVARKQTSTIQSAATVPYNQQQINHRTNTSTSIYEMKSNKNNITIEMPERLLTGRQMSPRTRERSLSKVVKNIGHVVEDAKKRYNGDIPTKVIVKMDKNVTQTA